MHRLLNEYEFHHQNRLRLSEVRVTQQSLRNLNQLPEMIEFVRNGGIFSSEAIRDYTEMRPGPVPRDIHRIAIAILSVDGLPSGFYIRNGHHRAVSIFLGGREVLLPEEFDIEVRTPNEFKETHFLNTDGSWMGWVTPFDIQTHCRLFNFGEYKAQVRDLYENDGPEAAMEFIEANQKLYCEPRRIERVSELANEVSPVLGELINAL